MIKRDAGIVLSLAVAALVARVPLGLVLVVVAAVVVIAVRGLRVAGGRPTGLLWPVLVAALVCALVATTLVHQENLLNQGGSLIIMAMVGLVAVATLLTGSPGRTASRLVDGLYGGLLLLWLIAMGEVVTGIKLMATLYPDAAALKLISANRLFVSATFPNYNDFCVAMVLLCAMEVARLVFGAGRGWRTGLSWFVLGTAGPLVVVMESRGALLGLLLVLGLAVVHSIRVVRPGLLNRGTLVIGSGLVLATVAGALAGGAFSDSSSGARVRIADTLFLIWGAKPLEALYGFGSLTTYKAFAEAAFPGTLMDPHNLLLEVAIWYGVPVLLLLIGCWLVLVWRGLVTPPATTHWRAVVSLVLVAAYPVLGVVPSSTLRYHVFWLVLIAATAFVADAGRLDEPPRDDAVARQPEVHGAAA